MLAKLRPRSVYDVLAAIGCFVALSTGSAYAANTIFSSDIVDGEVKTPDLASEAVSGPKLKPGAVGTDRLAGGAVTTDNVKDGTLAGRDVLDNSLKGADIDESTLNIGGGGAPVTIRKPVSVDDPEGGNFTSTPLMTAGPVTLEGVCFDSGATKAGQIRTTSSSSGMRFSVIQQTGDGVSSLSFGGAVADQIVLEVASGSPASNMGTFSFHDPGSSTYRSGTMFVSVNSAGDCAFALAAFG